MTLSLRYNIIIILLPVRIPLNGLGHRRLFEDILGVTKLTLMLLYYINNIKLSIYVTRNVDNLCIGNRYTYAYKSTLLYD